MTRIKTVNCINCQRFCQKIDKKDIIQFLKQESDNGTNEIIFTCELQGEFRDIITQVNTSIKIGEKNKKGKIKFLN